MQLSQRCLSIAASLTLEIDAQAKRMRAEGLDVIVTRVEHRRVIEIQVRVLPEEEPETK